jgi:hypothetical protein
MNQASTKSLLHNLLGAGVMILIAAYFTLLVLKSPFDFSNPTFHGSPSGITQAQHVIQNEPFDHLRTAALSILIGLLLASALLSLSAKEHHRISVAILISSSILVASTFFGLSPLATQPILLFVALYGYFIAWTGWRKQTETAS